MENGSVAFDRAAEYYDETRGFPASETQAIAAIVAQAGGLDVHSRVCEVGIGTGRIALPLASHVHLVTGVDLARPMLDKLIAKRADEPCLPVQGDTTRLPFADGVFDAVVAVHVFHLIPNWQDGLREVARVLRPGGVIISGWNDTAQNAAPRVDLRKIWAAVVGLEEQKNVGVPREQYMTFLADSGWQPVGERRTHTYPVTRPTREFVAQLERRVWSSSWRVSEEQHARGMAAVYAALDEMGVDLDLPVTRELGFSVEAYRPPAA